MTDDEEDDAQPEGLASSKTTLAIVGGLLTAVSVYALYRAQK